MRDYQNLKLKVSSNPHIRSNESTPALMRDVLFALVPALGVAVYVFGWRALTLSCVSVAGSVFFEWLYCKVMHKPQPVGDLSAAVTGLLLAMTCSVLMPYWMILVGDFFAIVVVKQLYGGIGKNFLNPALAGRAFLSVCYASHMATWAKPFEKAPLFGSTADVITAATPMSILKTEGLEAVREAYSVREMFIGQIGGSLGELSALALMLGGVYLLTRRVISWRIPACFLGTVCLLTLLFPCGNEPVFFMAYHLFGGGLMLNAFFMATDYVTSPVSAEGQIFYGIGCGILTVFIRYFGAYAEGACYAILTMNCLVWVIDKAMRPSRFGAGKMRGEGKK